MKFEVQSERNNDEGLIAFYFNTNMYVSKDQK